MPEGAFHVAVMAFIINDGRELLMTRRSSGKEAWAGYWECTAGSVLAGESSHEGMLREIREEIGFEMPAGQGRLVHSFIEDDTIWDAWLFTMDLRLEDARLQEAEVDRIKYVGKEEFLRMGAAGEIVPTLGFAVGLIEKGLIPVE